MFPPWIAPSPWFDYITETYWKSSPGLFVSRTTEATEDFLIFHKTSSPLIRWCWVSRERERERMFSRERGETHRRDCWGLGRVERLGTLHIPLCTHQRVEDWYLASKKSSREVATNEDGFVVQKGGMAPDSGPRFKHIALSRQVVEKVKRERGSPCPSPVPICPHSMESLLCTEILLCLHGQFKSSLPC